MATQASARLDERIEPVIIGSILTSLAYGLTGYPLSRHEILLGRFPTQTVSRESPPDYLGIQSFYEIMSEIMSEPAPASKTTGIPLGGFKVISHEHAMDDLLRRLRGDPNTLKTYVFGREGQSAIWAVVKDASFEETLKYSGYYVETLDSYPDFRCDFMVFGEDELSSIDIPVSAKVVDSDGGG